MRPQRRIPAADYGAAAYFDPVGKIYFVSGGNDTAGAQGKPRVNLVYYFRLENRINFIHSDDFRKSGEMNFVAATDNIQMTNTNVITDPQVLHCGDQIQVTNLYVSIDLAMLCVNDTQSNPYSLADPVTKEQSVTWTF